MNEDDRTKPDETDPALDVEAKDAPDASFNESNDGVTNCLEQKMSPEEEDCADAFFAKSFALNAERRETERLEAAFVGGLRSLFEDEEDAEQDADADTNDESDSEKFQRELELEHREAVDEELRQNDADFIAVAGRKYDPPRANENANARESLGTGGKDADVDLAVSVERRAKIRPESILEAMLFVGNCENKPLTLKTARGVMRDVSELEAIEALADLNERYYQEGRPYKVIRDGEGYRLVLKKEYADFVSRFSGKTKEFKLSQTAIDVLALIAYRQPITLEEILEVRPSAGSVLNQLVKRELISVEKQTIDRKKVSFYKTADRFLKIFNLDSLDDLPIVGDIDYR